jgi:uncharacterized membrane protein YtjA (UPF0391 family)
VLAQCRRLKTATSLTGRSTPNELEIAMLKWALIFLVVAIIAAVFGFGGIAGEAAWIAKILLVVFLILAVVSLLMGRKRV